MTPDEATEFAARILDAIDADERKPWPSGTAHAADRERVASDLAGLLRHQPISAGTPFCSRCCGLAALPWPCEDYTDRLAGLERTGLLYEVTR